MSKNQQIRILVIVASVRPVRRADAVLSWWVSASELAVQACDGVVEVADLRELALPMDDESEEPHTGIYAQEHTREWSRLVAGADAFVVITSEHNHSMPAALKNAFDHLSAEWRDKPVAWVSYGNTSAGTRSLVAAKQVATTLGMFSTGVDVSLRLWDWVGGEVPSDPARAGAAAASVQRLVRAARVMRPLREPVVAVGGLPVDLVASVATVRDAGELMVLQRCCWVDEAIANDTLDVPAWRDDIDDIVVAIQNRLVLVIRRGGRIVASAQAWQEGTTWRIGRLMVAPDQRRRGIARVLLAHMESQRPPDTARVALATGAGSVSNIAMYEAAGFTVLGSGGGTVELGKSA